MPAILSSLTMTMQPIPCCWSSLAISSNDLSEVVVKTPLPFCFKIVATFMSFLSIAVGHPNLTVAGVEGIRVEIFGSYLGRPSRAHSRSSMGSVTPSAASATSF